MANRKSVTRSRKVPKKAKKSERQRKSPKKSARQQKAPKKSARQRKASSRKSYRFGDELPNELLRRLEQVKEVSVVKTEINNLIREVSDFILADPAQRAHAISVVKSRADELERKSTLAFDKYYADDTHNNDEKCRDLLDKMEDEKEERGEQRTYPYGYFHDGDQEQLRVFGPVSEWIYDNWQEGDLREDLIQLFDVYRDAMQATDELYWIKTIQRCINRFNPPKRQQR